MSLKVEGGHQWDVTTEEEPCGGTSDELDLLLLALKMGEGDMSQGM